MGALHQFSNGRAIKKIAYIAYEMAISDSFVSKVAILRAL